jgi:hypothetical protein
MDNPEKLATQATQDKEKIIKNNEEKNPKLLFEHVHVYV